jgi:hypothetical protein
LGEGQLARAGAVVEVGLRRLLVAVGAFAEVVRVQIGGEVSVILKSLL